jgi:hypothetical protein
VWGYTWVPAALALPSWQVLIRVNPDLRCILPLTSHKYCNYTCVLIDMISLATGVLLLLAGRRLFWLAVGLAACLLTWRALASLLGEGWISLGLSLLAGLACAWLTVRFVRTVALMAGFLVGAILLPAGASLLGIDVGWYALALTGGVGGAVLVALAMNWGLILATAFAGAGAIAEGLRASLALSAPVANVILLALLALGVTWQASQLRRR